MSGTIVMIKADGTKGEVHFAGKGMPPLATLQRCVDGYIELVHVHYPQRRKAFVNEDGLRKQLPFNEQASILYGARIVGTMAIWVPDSRPPAGANTAPEEDEDDDLDEDEELDDEDDEDSDDEESDDEEDEENI